MFMMTITLHKIFLPLSFCPTTSPLTHPPPRGEKKSILKAVNSSKPSSGNVLLGLQVVGHYEFPPLKWQVPSYLPTPPLLPNPCREESIFPVSNKYGTGQLELHQVEMFLSYNGTKWGPNESCATQKPIRLNINVFSESLKLL